MEMARRHQARWAPRFFKPILPGYHQQLSIPSAFKGYLKGEKLNGGEAVLKSDNLVGRSWRVKIEGMSFGGDGWNDFTREHDLHVGDFLVFRHKGRLVFHVMVFDSTTCQREYLGAKTGMTGRNLQSTGIPLFEQRQGDAPYFTTQVKPSNLEKNFLNIPIAFARSHGLTNRCCVVTLRNTKGRVWEVNMIHTKNNRQVCILGGWKVFSKDNRLKINDICTFRLVSSGTKVIFQVSVSLSNGSHQHHNYRARNINGKREISESSASKREYLQDSRKRKRTRGQVEERGVMDLHSSPSSGTLLCERGGEKAPHFTTIMQLSNIDREFLNIPLKFARSNGLANRCCIITLRNKKGRYWKVNLHHSKINSQVYIKDGWKEFSKDNKLKRGDSCIFRLVSLGTKVIFEVSISHSRGSHLHRNYLTKNRNERWAMSDSTACVRKHLQGGGKRKRNKVIDEERGRQIILQSSTSSGTPLSEQEDETPCFTTKVKLSNLDRDFMNIPMPFARSNGLMNRCCVIILRNKQGRSWQVTLTHRKTKPTLMHRKMKPLIYIRDGWKVFSRDNQLKIRDICTFRLVSSGKKVVFIVTISRFSEKRWDTISNKNKVSEDLDSSTGNLLPKTQLKKQLIPCYDPTCEVSHSRLSLLNLHEP